MKHCDGSAAEERSLWPSALRDAHLRGGYKKERNVSGEKEVLCVWIEREVHDQGKNAAYLSQVLLLCLSKAADVPSVAR